MKAFVFLRRWFPQARPSGLAFHTFLLALMLEVGVEKGLSNQTGEATQSATINFSDLAAHQGDLPPATQADHAHMPVPGNLPVPDGIVAGNPGAVPGAITSPAPTADSPAPSFNFAALEDNNTSIPPDTHGAVGPNHLMVVLNTQVRIQDRTGNVISTVTLNSFWASLSNPAVFDPKVLYDSFNNRWIFVACADARSATSALLIGVSQTSDPTGNWFLRRIDADAANSAWFDYPSLGFNKNWIVVSGNMFPNAGGSFVRAQIYVFNKASLYAGGAGTHTLISNGSIGGTQVPALTHDNSVATMYLLQMWNGSSSGNGILRLYTITGAIGSEVLTPVTFVSTANPWDHTAPGDLDFAPQLGTSNKIQNNDSRIQNVVYRNGTLWAAHTVFLPAGGSPTRTAVQWWQLNTDGTILQRGRVENASGPVFYAFPSIAVNSVDDVMIGYSRFSASQYASANYSFRAASDAANTMQADRVLKAGEAPYSKTFSGSKNRWGDYSSTVVDPTNDRDLWTIQEYAATPSGGFDRWGTWWGRLSPVNSAPVTGGLSNRTIIEDGSTNFAFTVIDPDTAVGDLLLSTASSNTGLVAASGLSLGGSGTNRTLSITPLSNANGTATISVIADDQAGSVSTNSFTLTVQAVNDAPSFQLSTNEVVVPEDAALPVSNFLLNILAGPSNESTQKVSFKLTSADTNFFSVQPAINAAGTLSFKPKPNQTGTNTLSVLAEDTGGTTLGGTNRSAAQTFSIVVSPLNDAPAIAGLTNLTLLEDTSTNVAFAISDLDTTASSVQFAVQSSNTSLVTEAGLIVAGTTTDRTLSITPLANANGTATITVIGDDQGGGLKTNTFVLNVKPINDAPGFSLSTNVVAAAEDTPLTLANFLTAISPGPGNEASQKVSFKLAATATNLFAVQPAISPAGTLTLKPAKDAAGTTEVTVFAQDDGGAALGGTNRSPAVAFSVILTAANDAPVLKSPLAVTLKEDSSTNITFAVTDVDTSAGTVLFTATSSNTSLVTDGSLIFSGTGTNRSLAITPLSNANGKATISVIANDQNGGSMTNSVVLTVQPVNDAPSFTLSTNEVTGAEDTSFVLAGFVADILSGPANESAQKVSFKLTPTDTNFFSVKPAISAAGALTFKPAANMTGTNTVTVQAEDNGGTALGGTNRSPAVSFTVVVTAANDAPVPKGPSAVTIKEDTSTNITFTVTDVDTSAATVLFSAASSNTSLVTDASLIFSGSGTNRSLAITPLSDANGKATISIIANDQAGGLKTNSVVLAVQAVNDAPSFVLSTNVVSASEDAAFVLAGFVTDILAGPGNESAQKVSFKVTAADPSFFVAKPAISSTGTLTFKPATNMTGTNTVTVQAEDNGGTALGGTNRSPAQTFAIVVTPVDDAPALAGLAAITIKEDTSTNRTFQVSDVDTAVTGVLTSATSSNTSLVTDASLVISGTGTERTLAIVPLSNANGTATIRVLADDQAGGLKTNTFLLTVQAVNDAPSFSMPTNVVSVSMNAALQNIAGFVTDISPGPANESAQTLTFKLTVTSAAFYATTPTISPAGVLRFKPAANVAGTNTITVVAQDSGTTALGGTNRSPAQTFSIVVGAGGSAPALAASGSRAGSRAAAANAITKRTVLESPVRLPNGSVQFTVIGAAGRKLLVEASADLQDWTTIGSIESAEESADFTDLSALYSGTRFYRLVEP